MEHAFARSLRCLGAVSPNPMRTVSCYHKQVDRAEAEALRSMAFLGQSDRTEGLGCDNMTLLCAELPKLLSDPTVTSDSVPLVAPRAPLRAERRMALTVAVCLGLDTD